MIKKEHIAIMLGLSLTIIASGCKKGEKLGGTPLEKVDGITIYREDLIANLSPGVKLTPMLEDSLLKSYEKIVVLYLAAKDEGYADDPEIKRKAIWAKRMTIVNEYLNKLTSGIRVAPSQVKDYIEKRKDLFSRRVSLQIMYMYDTTNSKQVIEDFKKGRMARLSKLVKQGKINIEQHDDVNLGLWAMNFGDDNPFTKLLVNLKPGEVSKPFLIGGFYVVYKLLSEQKDDPNSPQIYEYVRQYLLNKKRQEVVDNAYKMYKGRYKVEVYKR